METTNWLPFTTISAPAFHVPQEKNDCSGPQFFFEDHTVELTETNDRDGSPEGATGIPSHPVDQHLESCSST